MVSERSDVLIIGAGAAGLAAAHELCGAGLTVQILEARNRVGGRINTIFDDRTKMPIELGAEFIHGRSPHIFELLDKHNLPVYEIGGDNLYLQDGKVDYSEQSEKHFEKILDCAKTDPGQDRAFAEFLKDITFADEKTKRRLTTFVEDYNAADAQVIGLKGLAEGMLAADKIDGDRFHRFVNGYSTLVNAFLNQLSENLVRVTIDTRARQITWSKGDIALEALYTPESGENEIKEYAARGAIITIPLNVLKAPAEAGGIKFVPPIDEKQACLKKIHMGNAIRITLVFRRVFWQDLDLPTQDGSTKSFFNLCFVFPEKGKFSVLWTYYPLRAPLVVAWVSGTDTDSMHGLSKEELENLAVESLAHVLHLSAKDVQSELTSSHVYDWLADEFSRGAYSYLGVGGLEAQKELARPMKNTLFFAGEATALDGHIGTVHGAIASGKRAAKELLNAQF
jgi:monoamine oxidase